ncbi:MAG: CDP-glycerol glycerophosphotransferase family protein [Verrucomicrobiae bacterium]|nr:CDP-glycerol glycerophosphotransferase family protein [Verrucomicrobiae bacterium]MCP5533539.1 CDP-glycerol glycerophosphotransferase family protein [Akkermansiaceae bacterium]MCP5542499.1 CDP-glycerol glycerophosphotransferase family protein [Akkermansiaceae bacterium]MCP5545966.1 CDP-glycerol glycerophosphotransferase family protein [Akkermansiaceae bacterium]
MARSPDPNVAFVGWNPFQFLHFAPIAARFPRSTLIVEKRPPGWDRSVLRTRFPESRIMELGPGEMEKLDGKFDILVCQTLFHGIGKMRKSRIAMLQYGYAKEAHNFGAWRSFADVCMTFGPYASQKVTPFCHAAPIGNPRFECWDESSFRTRAADRLAGRLDPAKKTLLYAPTWGALSSIKEFAKAIRALSAEYNVILKVHHNTQRFDASTLDDLRGEFGCIHGADEDIVELLAVSDALLSDFSGAIFDAIYGRVPVLLLGTAAPESTSDGFSLEQARRDELGEQVARPADLPAAVARVLVRPLSPAGGAAGLREELFREAAGAAARAEEVIRRLAAGEFRPNQSQLYIRKEMAELQEFRERSRRFGRWFRMLRRRS